ncbi:MAG: hypothetical protein KF754_00875 [Planctomycetes bacterium]|nr:hypothetical protein [Planctomycetota bacterium]
MKPIFRLGAAALTASVLLSGSVVSQEQPDEDQDPPMLTVVYDLHGLSQAGMEFARAPGMSMDLLAPDRVFGMPMERERHQWSLRASGREACCWESAEDAMESVAQFCSFDDSWAVRRVDNASGRSALVATQAMHDRVKWTVAALRNIATIRVNLRVHRLDGTTGVETPVLDARRATELARGARLVGAATSGLGDPVMLQQTGSTTFVADYDANAATGAGGHNPVTGNLTTGEEFVAGAIVLADGRVWVQGWHAARKLESMRKLPTVAGDVELPTATYSYTPVSAVVENGGATMMDAGPAGRFMLTATASGTVPDTRLDCGQGRELRLINATGTLRGHALGSRWMLSANTQEAIHDSMFGQIIVDEEYVDGPYNDAAIFMAENLDGFAAVEPYPVGPLLGLKMHPLDEEDSEGLAERADFERQVKAMCTQRDTVGLHARLVRVPAATALAAGLLNGAPTTAEIAELVATKGRVMVSDRMLSAGLEQNMDILDTRIAAMVHGYESVTATEIMLHDPIVRSLMLGSQFRWVARESGDGAVALEMRAGVTVGAEEFESVEVKLAGKGFSVERSRSNVVQARFGGELKVGQSLSHIVPGGGDNDELLVMVVTRLR